MDSRTSAESDIATHPEEMKGTCDLLIRKHVTIQGSARITPAGIIATGITICAVALAIGYASGRTQRGC